MLQHLLPLRWGTAIFLVFAILATSAWGQTYVESTLGFADGFSRFTFNGDSYFSIRNGTVVGVVLGVEPNRNDFGYSIGYGRDLSGDDNSSVLGAGLEHNLYNDWTWAEASIAQSTSDSGSATSIGGAVFRMLGDATQMVPYIGAGIDFAQVDIDECKKESVMGADLSAGIMNKIDDRTDVDFELAYNISQSYDLSCNVGQRGVVFEDSRDKTLGAFLSVKRRF